MSTISLLAAAILATTSVPATGHPAAAGASTQKTMVVHLRNVPDGTRVLLAHDIDGAAAITDAVASAGAITVPAGVGCLAFMRADGAVALHPLDLAAGGVHELKPAWRSGAPVRGVVISSDGTAITAEIRLQRPGGKPLHEDRLCREVLAHMGISSTTSGNNGEFRLAPVTAGDYELLVRREGYAEGRVAFTVMPGEVERTLEPIALQPVTVLTVAVSCEEVQEEPPFDLEIAHERPGWLRTDERWETTFSRAVSPLEVVAVGTRPGLVRFRLTKLRGELDFQQLAELLPGPQDVTLRPRPLFLSGTVSEDGRPAERATVRLEHMGSDASAVTSIAGEYALRIWSAADYGLEVMSADVAVFLDHVDLRDAEPGERRTRDIELPAARLSGTVVEKETRRPVEGADVILDQTFDERDMTSKRTTQTRADGSLEFRGVREARRSVVEVRASGFLAARVETAVMKGGTPALWIELERTEAVRGTVVGDGGAPVAGAQVFCCATGIEERFGQQTVSNERGEFTLDAPGGSAIFALAPGLTLGWGWTSDGRVAVRLYRRSAATTLRIARRDGSPVGGVLTYAAADGVTLPFALLFTDARVNAGEYRSGPDGSLAVASLPPGLYTALLRTAAGLEPLGSFTVPSSGTVSLLAPD